MARCTAGVIKVRSEATGDNTSIAAIVQSVEAAQARTAPVQVLADTVAGKFSIAVIALAVLTLLFWLLAGKHTFPEAARKAARSALNQSGQHRTDSDDSDDAHDGHGSTQAMEADEDELRGNSWVLLAVQLACNVLVVACPCALGLATPTAVLVGSSVAAKHGLLVRGGDVLEAMTHITHVVFDKTGTLTQGKPSIALVRSAEIPSGNGSAPAPEASQRWENALLALAAVLEESSVHPLAKAVVAERDRRGLARMPLVQGSLLQVRPSAVPARHTSTQQLQRHALPLW
jgi:cation transport ATPase